jgi:hypothetical protein
VCWVRKLLVRLRARGDNALRHGLRGRPSNRKMPEAVKRRAMALFRERKQATLWHDYGPTLAAEELAEQHGVAMSRETLRARYGELLQWDTSELDWLKGRGEKLYLIGMIDDATSPGWFGGPALTIWSGCRWVVASG